MALEVTPTENTIQLFDSFYSSTINVPVNEWDVVYSYFVGVLKGNSESETTKETAKKFAAVLFKIAQQTGTDIMVFMDYFRTNVETKVQVNTEMAYYLNLLKSKTALYGVSTVPTPNQAVQRNIIA
jgi:pyruvate/2-oxoacid:ferredoxin oxidoreductase alpha subunit|tara:strand:+ start:157 stop:534 length:378 start_codon:yes stop_codon:yes gene_type:complete